MNIANRIKFFSKPTENNFILENICLNGVDFVSTSGWTNRYNSSLSVLTGFLQATSGASSAGSALLYRTANDWFINKKCYAMMKARVTNSDCTSLRFDLRSSTTGTLALQIVENPVINQWYYFRVYAELTFDNIGDIIVIPEHLYVDSATANGKVMQIEEVQIYDLTDTNGLGSEPDELWCDTNILFVK